MYPLMHPKSKKISQVKCQCFRNKEISGRLDIQKYNTIHSFFNSTNLLEHMEGSVLAMTRTQGLPASGSHFSEVKP